LKGNDVMKMIADHWNKMSDAAKSPYLDSCKKGKDITVAENDFADSVTQEDEAGSEPEPFNMRSTEEEPTEPFELSLVGQVNQKTIFCEHRWW